MIGSWFLAVLGKDQRFIIHFILVSGSRRSTRSAWSLRLRIFEGLPAIKERKAVVNGLGVIRAAKALHQLEEADHVLCTADCGKRVRCFEVVFEGGGALVEDDDVSLGHVLVVLVPPILSFGMLAFP